MPKRKIADKRSVHPIDIVQKESRVKSKSSGKIFIVIDVDRERKKISIQPQGIGTTIWNTDISNYELLGQPHVAYRPAMVSVQGPREPAKMYISRFPRKNNAR